MEDKTMTFGGNKRLKLLAKITGWVADFTKWFALLSITRLNKISRWLSGASASMLLNSHKNTISNVKINLLNRHVKQFRFQCNGKKRCCYENGDYANIYKVHKKEDLAVTDTDLFYVRYNQNWRKD
tara:strand:- start:311 stop:688 length:378 start_codon:yes stop_codon:yes gene_type:complete